MDANGRTITGNSVVELRKLIDQWLDAQRASELFGKHVRPDTIILNVFYQCDDGTARNQMIHTTADVLHQLLKQTHQMSHGGIGDPHL